MKPFVELAPETRTLPIRQLGSVVMVNRVLLAGAFLGLSGLIEAAPAEANGWEARYPVNKPFGPVRYDWGSRPAHYQRAFGTSGRHHRWHGHVRQHGHRDVDPRLGFFARPFAPVWRRGLAAPVVSRPTEYVTVGHVEPAVSIVTATYGFAGVGPICGSYAAPIGYHGVIYNRPFCPCD